jgi:hypothetical protein
MKTRRPWLGVVELPRYRSRVDPRLTEDEQTFVVESLAQDPELGVLISNGGGLRKLRVAMGGHGKRGGGRVIYYFYNEYVYAKNEKSDLSRQELADLVKQLRMLREELYKKGK